MNNSCIHPTSVGPSKRVVSLTIILFLQILHGKYHYFAMIKKKTYSFKCYEIQSMNTRQIYVVLILYNS